MISAAQTATGLLTYRLQQREEAGLLRQLRVVDALGDFCSNDYLGLACSPELREAIRQADLTYDDLKTGATGSRLLAGQTALAEAVETELAQFYQTETALLFNAGYDANLGLLACLPQRGDVLLTDELVHASMIDGARLCYADRQRFRHNDLNDLAEKLRDAALSASGQVFVAVESLYSMDGDTAPLPELCNLCDRYGAALLVDEAHATGVYGPNGEGLVVEMGLQGRVLARVHTFGKALGIHGATVVGPAVLRDYLINFARPFIYSTALPPHSLLAIREAHRFVQLQHERRQQLRQQISQFRELVQAKLPQAKWTNSLSAIQCLIVPGNDRVRAVAAACQRAGFDVRPIVSPTVAVGQERLRICLHAFNTEEEIQQLVEVLTQTGSGCL